MPKTKLLATKAMVAPGNGSPKMTPQTIKNIAADSLKMIGSQTKDLHDAAPAYLLL